MAAAQRPLLVLNVGSSSLKACVIDGHGSRLWEEQRPWSLDQQPAEATGLAEALAPWLDRLELVAHRVVHGGERFTAPTRIDAEVERGLGALVPLAPLHNPPALAVIRWLRRWRPELPQWACFDTGFHRTLPAEAFTYALPPAWRRQGLRRFGFHGLNHQHVSEVVAARLDPPPGLNLISAHLGAGCSLAAIRDGRSLDTTMGFTPLEGLVMASRSGSLDPGLLLHLLRQGVSVDALETGLQREGGLRGLSELSGDMRELRHEAGRGHAGAQLALAVFRHRLLQGIGAMAASLGGLDVLALSGGIGANDSALEQELIEALGWLKPFTCLRIPAEEHAMIARLCRPALAGGGP